MYTVMTLIEQASFLILIEASNDMTHHSALERHLDGAARRLLLCRGNLIAPTAAIWHLT